MEMAIIQHLTMANRRAIGHTLVSQWKVDEEAHTRSDHIVIQFMVANERITTGETVTEHLNWKKANGKAYNKAFRATLDKRRHQMDGMMNQECPTREALEDTADAI